MEINTKREGNSEGSYSKKVGLGEFKVLAFNPTREELNKILGRDNQDTDKELEYTGESAEGNKTVRITAWCEEVKTGFKTPVSFFLEDVDTKSRTGKYQYVNAVGSTSYVDSEENLQAWFKKAMTYRIAKKGEEELMKFLRGWLSGIELNIEKGGSNNNILLNTDRLFKGNVRELNELVSSEFAGTVTALVTVKTREVDENGKKVTKQYQNVFNKEFLPGSCMRFFRNGGQKPKFVQNFVDQIEGEYGCKDFYVMTEIRDYVEGENPVTASGPLLTQDGPDYATFR